MEISSEHEWLSLNLRLQIIIASDFIEIWGKWRVQIIFSNKG